MKKIFLIFLFGTFLTQTFSQSVTNSFEDGNWLYYFNICWGIGPNNTNFRTTVTANSNQGFNGTKVCETGNLGQTTLCRLESPWIQLIPGNITFNHAIPSFDGTRNLKIFAIQNGTNTETQLGSTFTYANSAPVNTTIPVTLTGVYKIQWRWEGSGGNSRGQLDNIGIPGTNISDPSANCSPMIAPPPADSDSDGVPDANDEYPNDPYRAYNNYYPASDTGSLAFEDNWPSYGDYDLNDLVIGYQFKVVSNAQHNVVEIYNTLILRANGAAMSNGFGYQLPGVNPASIRSVTGVGDQTGFSIAANGTETGNPVKATIIVFDKSHRYMPEWNTPKHSSPVPYRRFHISIQLMNNGVPGPGGAVDLNTLDIVSWNPFIVVNGNRGREVHLPNYLPTDLADPALFGTANDNTQPGIGKYYKSPRNLPWALDVYGKFDYPAENMDISSTYLHFGEWVESNGAVYLDWWSNTTTGYRNTQKIY